MKMYRNSPLFSSPFSCYPGENDERDLNQLKRRAAGVCYNWKESGDCKFGANCRFAHENLPEKEPKAE